MERNGGGGVWKGGGGRTQKELLDTNRVGMGGRCAPSHTESTKLQYNMVLMFSQNISTIENKYMYM